MSSTRGIEKRFRARVEPVQNPSKNTTSGRFLLSRAEQSADGGEGALLFERRVHLAQRILGAHHLQHRLEVRNGVAQIASQGGDGLLRILSCCVASSSGSIPEYSFRNSISGR